MLLVVNFCLLCVSRLLLVEVQEIPMNLEMRSVTL